MTGDAERFFDAISGRYDREYALPAPATRDRMARVLRELPPAPARLLDLGVGTGRELPALLDAGHAVTGVDVSTEMLARCRRRARPIPLVQADFWQTIPTLATEGFDAALALHGTLAHPPDGEALARLGLELGRLLVAGGVLVAEVPTPRWLEAVAALPESTDRRVRVTGPGTCLFEDRVAGVSLGARMLDQDAWQAAFGPAWTTRCEPLGDLEWLVVARRSR